MKEINIPTGLSAFKYASELTGEPNSTYAKSRISHTYMPNPDTNFDPIDTPLGGGSQRSLEEELQSSVEQLEEANGYAMSDAEKEAYRDFLVASRANPDASRGRPQQHQEQETPTNLPPGMAEMMGLAPSKNKNRTEKETQRARDAEKAYRNPEDLDEIVQAIADYDTEFHKDFPLFTEVQVKDSEGNPIKDSEGNTKKEKIIHDSNFLRYVRKRMRYFEGEEGPDTKINYFTQVSIEFGPRTITMNNLIGQEAKYFKDAKGVIHEELAQQIRRELFVRHTVRGRDIDYRTGGKGMGDDAGIAGIMGSLFKDNNMTRNTWYGKSMWHWLLEMPHEMALKTNTEHGEPKLVRDDRNQDTRLGRGIATSLMAYYHIADFNKLKEMFKGGGESFFTRGAFEEARKELVSREKNANPFASAAELSALEEKYIKNKQLDSIFTGNGINEEEFVDYMNIFPHAQIDPRRRDLVRQMIRIGIRDKYKLYIKDIDGNVVMDENGRPKGDNESMSMAEEYAFLSTRWTGAAARNDLTATAHDAQSKILNFKKYRMKQASMDRGGAFGNMYNVGLFNALGVNYLDSIRTQDGRLLREMLEDLARVEVADDDNPEKVEKEKEESRRLLSDLNFPDASESNFSTNGVNRWFGEFESFIGGKELHLQKVVEWASLRGVVYDPAQFGELIQEGFLKPLRYGYSTWQTLYNKDVRDLVKYDPTIHAGMPTVKVGKEERYVYQDTSIAESMFGNQVLDVESFWDGVPKRDKDGNVEKDKNDKPKIATHFDHIIEADRINENRPQLFKQMALARIAADIYSHRDRKSPYQLWDAATVEALIRALERVPGGLLVDENNLQHTSIPQYFFTDGDIKYLRSLAHVTYANLITKDGGKAVLKEGGKLFGRVFKAVIKGLK